MMDTRNKGFSLVEVMIVMVIVGIIMSLGIPGYRGYLQRANRADATTALLRISAAQERFFIANGTYASNAQLAGAPPAGLGIDGTERGFYNLNVLPAAGGLATGYILIAQISPGGDQADDTDCAAFSTTERGQRRAFDGGGADNTDTCWR
jgi:type IV pilus assembly protein PilE